MRNADGTQNWYANTEKVELEPETPLTAKRYLFVFCCLENYNRGRDGWIEGSSYIDNDVELTLSAPCEDLFPGEINDLSAEDDAGGFSHTKPYQKGEVVEFATLGLRGIGNADKASFFISPEPYYFTSLSSGANHPGAITVVVAVGGEGQFKGAGYSTDSGITWRSAEGTGRMTSVDGTEKTVRLDSLDFQAVIHTGGKTLGVDDGLFIAFPVKDLQRGTGGQYLAGQVPWSSPDGATWTPGSIETSSPAHSDLYQECKCFCFGRRKSGNRLWNHVIFASGVGSFYSTDGKHWIESSTPVRAVGSGGHNIYYPFSSIACDNSTGIWMATSEYADGGPGYEATGLFASDDAGINWRSIPLPGDGSRMVEKVMCANRLWMAMTVGGDRYYCYEWDGNDEPNWHKVETSASTFGKYYFNDIGYRDGRMLMATDNGIFWSDNGLNWNLGSGSPLAAKKISYREITNPHPVPGDEYYYDPAWYAVSEFSGHMGVYRSLDNGETWVKVLDGPYNDIEFFDETPVIAERWIMVCGRASHLKRSGKGTEWDGVYGEFPATDPSRELRDAVRDICFDGKKWISACYFPSGGGNGVFMSTDGKNWYKSGSANPLKVKSNGKIQVAAISAGLIYSTDWFRSYKYCTVKRNPDWGTSPYDFGCRDLICADDKWMCLSGSEIYFSYDGIEWCRSISDFGQLTFSSGCVRYARGIWVAVLATESESRPEVRVVVSDDGATWVTVMRKTSSASVKMAYADDCGVWLVLIGGELYRSTDGRTWNAVDAKTSEGVDASFAPMMATDGSKLVIVSGDGGGVYTAPATSDVFTFVSNNQMGTAPTPEYTHYNIVGVECVAKDFIVAHMGGTPEHQIQKSYHSFSKDCLTWTCDYECGMGKPLCYGYNYDNRLAVGYEGAYGLIRYVTINSGGSKLKMECTDDINTGHFEFGRFKYVKE